MHKGPDGEENTTAIPALSIFSALALLLLTLIYVLEGNTVDVLKGKAGAGGGDGRGKGSEQLKVATVADVVEEVDYNSDDDGKHTSNNSKL